jgi:hypothetical protein
MEMQIKVGKKKVECKGKEKDLGPKHGTFCMAYLQIFGLRLLVVFPYLPDFLKPWLHALKKFSESLALSSAVAVSDRSERDR